MSLISLIKWLCFLFIMTDWFRRPEWWQHVWVERPVLGYCQQDQRSGLKGHWMWPFSVVCCFPWFDLNFVFFSCFKDEFAFSHFLLYIEENLIHYCYYDTRLYLSWRTSFSDDVMKHITDTNMRAAETVRQEMQKERHTTLVQLKKIYMDNVRKVLHNEIIG